MKITRISKIKNGTLHLTDLNVTDEDVYIEITPYSEQSDRQYNLLMLWLRIISEETGAYWRVIYDEVCSIMLVDKRPKELNQTEIRLVLKELEKKAVYLEIILPFPKKWSRIIL